MGRGGQLCFLKWVSSPPLEIALGTNWGFIAQEVLLGSVRSY